MNVTDWVLIVDPLAIPVGDYVLSNPGRVTRQKLDKLEESIRLTGLAPVTVHAEKREDGRIYLLDHQALWVCVRDRLLLDPREMFDIYLPPMEKTNRDTLLVEVKMNRAVTPYDLPKVVQRFANFGEPEYIQLRQLALLYPAVSMGDIAIALRPDMPVLLTMQELENGTYVATNPVGGAEAVKFLNELHTDLERLNRVNFLKRNRGLVIEMAKRFQASGVTIDYTGAPGRNKAPSKVPNICGIIPNPAAVRKPVVRAGQIKYTLIHEHVVQDDINFPRKPFTSRTSTKRNWNMQILDSMGLPRHP